MAYLAVNIPVVREAGVLPRLCLPSVKTMTSVVRDSLPRSLALVWVRSRRSSSRPWPSNRHRSGFRLYLRGESRGGPRLRSSVLRMRLLHFRASEASALERREEFTRILRQALDTSSFGRSSRWAHRRLRAHLVRVILGSGAFDWEATRATAALLAILAVGLVAQGSFYSSRARSMRCAIVATAHVSVPAARYGGSRRLLFFPCRLRGFPASLAVLLRVSDISERRFCSLPPPRP